ncbi:MAG: Helicase associated domain protein, partial [Lachnospiraceae bacterium]|nr:Helicase associated domain protein [Lachnospiraceae bacterium]
GYPGRAGAGTSATAIRYLDNQRDMSDELFGGNIASEMTLGEAIVRGILNPPKYVLSVYSYQKDLEKYQRRVRRAKNKAVRDAGEEQLNALRRALEHADGLDEIFGRHMKNPAGKYIVFCANYEHMAEMIGKAEEWFGKVDRQPHIYTAYSDDPETSQAFAEFKADESDHLKLLYCIDMLNEGIHVEDIQGVVLLRPTVSPIIYKQQIGRALSASKKTDAVIFDIVLNIENLYSIGAIEEEMQIAASYYHYLDRDDEVVQEHFEVIDEVQDCMALFRRLDETLAASWEMMYGFARQYYKRYGNLEVPVKYKTEDGYSLGRWLLTQRKVRAGEKY